MSRLDPRVKLEFVILSTAAAMAFRQPTVLCALAAITLAATLIYGGDIVGFLNKFKGFALILLGVAVVQILFIRTGVPMVKLNGFTAIYSDGLSAGMGAALRFFIIMCAACIMAGEDSRRVIQGLVNMKIPYFFAFMLTIALRFVPFFREAFSQSMISIQLRGVELKKIPVIKRVRLFSYLLLPVVAEAIIRAQDLAVSMEARGFGALPRRTSIVSLRLGAVDAAMLLLQAAGFGAAMVWLR